MGNALFATKSLDVLMREAGDTSEHSLKRALGPVNLVTLGIGAVIGAGIFVLTGSAAALYAGPAIILSYDCGLGLYLRLFDARRDRCLDHRLGFDSRIRIRRSDRR